MKSEEYLDRLGKIERPPINPLEGQVLRFEITDRREIRPSTFLEKLQKKGLKTLIPVESIRIGKRIA